MRTIIVMISIFLHGAIERVAGTLGNALLSLSQNGLVINFLAVILIVVITMDSIEFYKKYIK